MIDSSTLPPAPQTILLTRLDALGDIVLGTMLLSGVHAKWPDAKLILVVRPQMANVTHILPDWVEVRPLPFDPRESVIGREGAIVDALRAFCGPIHASLAIVAEYNRTWAGEIVAEMCGSPTVLVFDGPTGLNVHHRPIAAALNIGSQERWQTVHVEADSREPVKYAAFLDAMGMTGDSYYPSIAIGKNDRADAAALWQQAGHDAEKTLILFPGSGDRFSRSLDSGTWSRWIGRLSNDRPVLLLGSALDEPVLDAIAASGLPNAVSRVIIPVEKIGVTAAFFERAGAYIGMDTGPTHIAAALGRPTLAIFGGGHRAERFLPVGRRAAAVRMPIGCYGCDWICPFERRLCIKDIPEQPLFEIGDIFLHESPENAALLAIRVFDVHPPSTLPTVLLGPLMLQNRQFLQLNHDLSEHHAYQAAKMQEFMDISGVIAEMSEQNRCRDNAIAHLSDVISEMTRQNISRDNAIAHLAAVISEMSRQNKSRDEAIAHINRTLAEMTQQNNSRDRTIATISQGRKNRQ